MVKYKPLARPKGAPRTSHPDQIVFVSRGRDGHRGDYEDFVAGLFDAEAARGGLHLFENRPVLFLMIEEDFAKYFASAVGRALLGRVTVGLLFRGTEAARATTVRLKLKNAMLRLLKRIKPVRTISIVPFSVVPAISKVADDWIYDFQLWDRPQLARPKSSERANGEFIARVRQQRKRSRVLISLGGQNENKGINLISHHASGMIAAGWTPVVAGPVAVNTKDRAAAIAAAGGIVEDRILTEEELLAAYEHADLVWCVYHPKYDQASGIFGRAVQAGVPVAVRENSVSQRFCQMENIEHIAVPWSDLWQPAALNLALLSSPARIASDSLVARFREKSLDKLSAALRPASA